MQGLLELQCHWDVLCFLITLPLHFITQVCGRQCLFKQWESSNMRQCYVHRNQFWEHIPQKDADGFFRFLSGKSAAEIEKKPR